MKGALFAVFVLTTACGEAKPANAPDDLPSSAPSGGPCGGTSPGPGYRCLQECGPSGGGGSYRITNSHYHAGSPPAVVFTGASAGIFEFNTITGGGSAEFPGGIDCGTTPRLIEDSIVVPASAVQVSQTGPFVFIVKDGAAVVQPVKVARMVEGETVIESGLDGGETVVTDGHLLLTNGTRVTVRGPRAGA